MKRTDSCYFSIIHNIFSQTVHIALAGFLESRRLTSVKMCLHTVCMAKCKFRNRKNVNLLEEKKKLWLSLTSQKNFIPNELIYYDWNSAYVWTLIQNCLWQPFFLSLAYFLFPEYLNSVFFSSNVGVVFPSLLMGESSWKRVIFLSIWMSSKKKDLN